MRKNSIKTKLIVSFGLVILVAFVIVNGSVKAGIDKVLGQEIQDKILLLAEAKEGQVYVYLDSLELITAELASGAIRDKMAEIARNNSAKAIDGLNEYLVKRKGFPDSGLIDIHVLNKEGIVTASTDSKEIGKDKHEDRSFIDGEREVTVYSPLEEYSDLYTNVLEVDAPLKDENTGEFLGVVVNVFKTDKLKKVLSGAFQIERGAKSFLVSNIDTLSIHLINQKKRVIVHEHVYAARREVIDTLPVNECINNQKEVSGEYINHDGVSVAGASMCLSKLGWTLLVEIDSGVAFVATKNMTMGVLIMLAIVFLILILEIFLIVQRFIVPVKKLHDASDRITQGDFDSKVDIKTGDELESLADEFNQMAAKLKKDQLELKQYTVGLEAAVVEKTKDLQDKVDDLNKIREAILNVAEDAEEEKQRTIRERDKIDAILHSIGDGVFVVDQNLKVVVVNAVAAKMSGYKAEEILGTRYTDKLKFIFEDTGKINDEFVKKALETKTVQEMANHTVLIDKFGNKTQVSDSAAPLLDSRGRATGCVVVFRDVTKEWEIDKAKTEFVSLASHQLKTPPTAIKWLTEMLLENKKDKLTKKQKEYLNDIQDKNEQIIKLVNALLDVSRIELGTFAVAPAPVDVNLLVRGVIKGLELNIGAKDLRVTEKYAAKKLVMSTDANLLQIVIQNLLTNAVNYTPKKGRITVEVALKQKGNIFGKRTVTDDSAVFTIADTGYGIPKAQQDRIFTKLFRADNAREKFAGGTGLGLYIVKSIVGSFSGKVWFESEENKGTTFYVIIPLAGTKLKEGGRQLTSFSTIH